MLAATSCVWIRPSVAVGSHPGPLNEIDNFGMRTTSHDGRVFGWLDGGVIFVEDQRTGTVVVATVNSAEEPIDGIISRKWTLSGSGRFVFFHSGDATNAGPTLSHVYRRDLELGTTTAIAGLTAFFEGQNAYPIAANSTTAVHRACRCVSC